MSYNKYAFRRGFASLVASSWCATAGLSALAAESSPVASADAPSPADLLAAPVGLPAVAEPASPAPPATPSQNVTINLINRLVQRGVLTKEDAAELIKQAEADAAAATAAAQGAPASDDSVRVTYIPEVVKDQIRDDLRQEVMKQAYEEKWAAPRTFPDWVSRFRLFGDLRIRYEGDFYPSGNDNAGAFPNFNSINTGSPFDVTGNTFSPQYNVDQDRNRVRLRARLGTEADLGDGFTTGIRIATGENNSPVTENQSFGVANQAQGGNFSKYAIWLDRAFLKYELGGKPEKDLTITIGRFDNPFFASKMIWADDLGFDGAVVQGRYQVLQGVTPFLTLGGFPVFNTDLNFATNNPSKFKSEDKWLTAVQGGIDWKINKDFSAKLGIAYYDFIGVEGKLSDPFTPLTAQDNGNTDDSRPSFAQKGNTYMALRDIVPTVDNSYGTKNQWQYFGLATPFRELALTGRLDYSHFDPFHIFLTGEVVKNTAFSQGAINAKAVNNRGSNDSSGSIGKFAGGDLAWNISLNIGNVVLEKRWDWNASLGYRYVESDAVVDGFCDSDFGGGGTNLKGFTFGGNLALSPRVWVGLRWMSADSIAGPTYKNDVIQIDLNTKF